MNARLDESTLLKFARGELSEIERKRVEQTLSESFVDRQNLSDLLEIIQPGIEAPPAFLAQVMAKAAEISVRRFLFQFKDGLMRAMDAAGNLLPSMSVAPELVPLSGKESTRILIDLGALALAISCSKVSEGVRVSADLIRGERAGALLHCEEAGIPVEELALDRQSTFDFLFPAGEYQMTLHSGSEHRTFSIVIETELR